MSGRVWFRSLSVVLFLALVTSLAPQVSSASPPPASVAEKSKPVGSRPDRVSAMSTARAQGSRVEDLSQATPTSATFANPDGTWTTEAYSGVVRSKTNADTWVPVDATVTKKDRAYEPTAAPIAAKYSDGGDRKLGSVTTAGGTQIGVGWPTRLPAPTAEGDRLTYPGAAGGADLVVTSAPEGFNYSMVLDHAPAADAPPVEYRILLDFGGAKPVVHPDGSIVVKDGKEQVATMSAPVMWDDANNAQEGDRHPVSTSVEGTGDALTLVLRPDMGFLRDPSTTYPVTVDPSVSVVAANDTWVNSLTPSASQYNSVELQVGSSTNLGLSKSRSFLYFDFTQMPAGSLLSAQLRLSNFLSYTCTGTAVRMSQITGAWSVPALTWSNQPATTATGSSTSTAAYGATGCAAEGTVTFDATAIASSWFNDHQPNYGLQLKADDEAHNSGFRKFRSLENGDPSKVPTFEVTYNVKPNTPTDLTVSPLSNGYTSSLTPTLSAVVSDPDGGQVRGLFQVRSGSTVVWSGTSAMTASGGRVTVTVPAGVLVDGTSYTVAVFGQDGTLSSDNSPPWKPFTVDVTAPTVAISWSPFTNGAWSPTLPSSNTLTLNGSADTAGFYTVLDGVPYTVGANASGVYTSTTWAPTPGWHTLEATPLDRAGNLGATSTFSFGTGTAGISPPVQNARSTSTFPIEMTAPPNATGATVSWKLAGEATWRATTQVTKAGATWSGAVSTASGHASTGTLLWNATAEPDGTGTLTAPATINLRGCFQYSGSADSCTGVRTVQLVPSAFGGNFPVTSLGPASVALFTGEASISATDAADSRAGLGRSFSSFDAATLATGAFGPGWSDPAVLAPSPDSTASVVDNRAKDGTFVIIDKDSGSQTFVAASGSTTSYVPLEPTGDATGLTFTPGANGNPDKLELSRPLGSGTVKTTWLLKAPDTGGNPVWTFDSVAAPGTANDIAVDSTNQRPTWVRESDPSISATCTATTQTVGCRGLAITYTGTGASTRVASVARVIGAATQANVGTKTLATYTYDASNRLASACSAAPAAGKPALCTTYTYTTLGGRTLLSQITPAGLKPWRFAYDTSSRLQNVKRELPGGGDATWSIDYGLTPTSAGLPDLSTATAAQWGQQTLPTKVFAVYAPYSGAADVSKAQLYYTTTDGTVTNTAGYGPTGWLLDTNWYDTAGHVVQHLDPTGYARAQAASGADRPQVAAEASSYTIYNTWGDANTVGTRVVDEYGPAHTATLKNGTTGLFRTHTATIYDDQPGVDPSLIASRPDNNGRGLVVKVTTSASNLARTADNDALVTKYDYAPVVTGDGDGWTLGTPTKTLSQLGSGWSEQITRYDTSGRVIESRQPGGSEDAAHAGNDAHSTDTTYYTATGSGDCGGKPAWDGLVCKTGPAAQPSGPAMPTSYTAAYNDDLVPTSVQEYSGGTLTRTTTTSYDDLGRPTAVTKATTGPDVTNETIATSYGYDDTTGLPTTMTASSKTITTGYDSWGRQNAYTDALGTASATTYDAADRTATFNDGTATYTYTYDNHGLLTSVDAGGGVGNFTYAYTPAGDLDTITYPNGVTAKRQYDQTSNPTGLTYSQGTTPLLAFTATNSVDGRMLTTSSAQSAQTYAYDDLGRLTTVQDTRTAGCTTRTYGFDPSSNRIDSASYAPGTNGACQTTSAALTKSSTYDSAGRIRNTGYSYDTLGRTLTTPQTDAGPNAAGDLAATYHADDMVATLAQNVHNAAGGTDAVGMSYALDPLERISAITSTTNGTETERLRYRFAEGDDSPASIQTSTDAGNTWTSVRYVGVPQAGMVATSVNGTLQLEIANLHGDIVATMPATSGSTVISSYRESDEFGNPPDSANPSRYAWLGSRQRAADAIGGLALMGSRLYNPVTGAFLSADPELDGNVTAYTYPQDPVNQRDLDGRACILGWGHCSQTARRQTGSEVSISWEVWHKVTDYHKVPSWIVYRAIWYARPAIFRSDYAAYEFRIWEYRCTSRFGCYRTGKNRWLNIIINWNDGKKGHGYLVTMYCRGIHKECDQWIQTAAPYFGPPGPQ